MCVVAMALSPSASAQAANETEPAPEAAAPASPPHQSPGTSSPEGERAKLETLPPLEKARGLQAELRPQEALEVVDAHLAEGGKAVGETLRAWALRGELLAQLGEGAEAERSYQVVLRISPEWTLDDAAPPAAREPFLAALATKPEEGEGFVVATAQRVIGDRAGIEVSLLADDLGRIRGCGLVGTDRIIPLDKTHPIAFVPLDTRAKGMKRPLKVAVVDAASNTWSVATVDAAEGEADVRWLTIAGAATATAGLFAASAFGIGYTAVVASDEGTATALLAGVGAASVVAAVGAAMVLTDALFLSEEIP